MVFKPAAKKELSYMAILNNFSEAETYNKS